MFGLLTGYVSAFARVRSGPEAGFICGPGIQPSNGVVVEFGKRENVYCRRYQYLLTVVLHGITRGGEEDVFEIVRPLIRLWTRNNALRSQPQSRNHVTNFALYIKTSLCTFRCGHAFGSQLPWTIIILSCVDAICRHSGWAWENVQCQWHLRAVRANCWVLEGIGSEKIGVVSWLENP